MSVTVKEIRLGLQSILERQLVDVEVWPGLLNKVPRLPAVVIRRGPYKTDEYYSEGDPDPSFDILCCLSFEAAANALDMDDLVASCLAELRANRSIDSLVADLIVVGVGREERVAQGGPENAPMLVVPITIKVIQL